MAYAADSKSADGNIMGVQVPPPAYPSPKGFKPVPHRARYTDTRTDPNAANLSHSRMVTTALFRISQKVAKDTKERAGGAP